MIGLPGAVRVYLYRGSADLRRSFDGLSGLDLRADLNCQLDCRRGHCLDDEPPHGLVNGIPRDRLTLGRAQRTAAPVAFIP